MKLERHCPNCDANRDSCPLKRVGAFAQEASSLRQVLRNARQARLDTESIRVGGQDQISVRCRQGVTYPPAPGEGGRIVFFKIQKQEGDAA